MLAAAAGMDGVVGVGNLNAKRDSFARSHSLKHTCCDGTVEPSESSIFRWIGVDCATKEAVARLIFKFGRERGVVFVPCASLS